MNAINLTRASLPECRFAFVLAVLFLGANAFAQGAADKVTGEYTRAGCYDCQPDQALSFISYRLLEAHEATSKRPQKGFFFAVNDAGRWFELDFTDTFNT